MCARAMPALWNIRIWRCAGMERAYYHPVLRWTGSRRDDTRSGTLRVFVVVSSWTWSCLATCEISALLRDARRTRRQLVLRGVASLALPPACYAQALFGVAQVTGPVASVWALYSVATVSNVCICLFMYRMQSSALRDTVLPWPVAAGKVLCALWAHGAHLS